MYDDERGFRARRRYVPAVAAILRACVIAAALLGVAEVFPAGTYPIKPIRIIIPYPPGGSNDLIGRAVADKLSQRMGEPCIVDNRGGAATITATEMAAKAPADGYTLLLATVRTLAVNPSLYKKLPYNPVKDFEPISQLASQPYLLVAHPSIEASTMADLLRIARTRPGSLTLGSPGAGSNGHLAGELLKSLTGIDVMHVPYHGLAPALSDLVGGQISLMFVTIPAAQGFVKAGRVRALAVSTVKRSPAMPDVPTIAESGVRGYEIVSWNGLVAPAGTSHAIIERLNREVERVLDASDVRARLTQQGFDPTPSRPRDFERFIRSELTRYRFLVQMAGMTAE
jgi:tripartite-type tricarboxylate transporter receptor subunit TctC